MQTIDLRRAVATAAAGTGVLHLILAPEYLAEQAYVGVLFILGGLASIALAGVIWKRGDMRAVGLAAALAAGMAVGFVMSRTTGLPGFHEGEWELSGLVSLLLESVVVAGALALARQRPSLADPARS